MNKTDKINFCLHFAVACCLAGCYTQLAPTSGSDLREEDFCVLVEQGKFEETGTIINMVLETIEEPNDKDLEQLVTWLESKSCVTKVDIVCRSCIFTFPPQSHVRVHFRSRGRTIPLMMDISMGQRLRFLRYHD